MAVLNLSKEEAKLVSDAVNWYIEQSIIWAEKRLKELELGTAANDCYNAGRLQKVSDKLDLLLRRKTQSDLILESANRKLKQIYEITERGK